MLGQVPREVLRGEEAHRGLQELQGGSMHFGLEELILEEEANDAGYFAEEVLEGGL